MVDFVEPKQASWINNNNNNNNNSFISTTVNN